MIPGLTIRSSLGLPAGHPEVRPQFAQFVSQRSGKEAASVESQATAFPLRESENGTFSSDVQTLLQFRKMEADSYDACKRGGPEAQSKFQVLYNMLPQEIQAAPFDGSAGVALEQLLHQSGEILNQPVVTGALEMGPDGMMAIDLLQAPVEVSDFSASSKASTAVKATLFIDTTPGQDGAVAYLEPHIPVLARPSESEQAADPTSVNPGPQIRPAIQALLAPLAQADNISRGQRLDQRFESSNEYIFAKDGHSLGVICLEARSDNPIHDSVVPGIQSVRGGGLAAIAGTPNQPYGEMFDLNGDERKALLSTLYGLKFHEPANPYSMTADEATKLKAIRNHEALIGATTQLLAVVTDGNLAFYDKLVTHYDDKDSWLQKVRHGSSPATLPGRNEA